MEVLRFDRAQKLTSVERTDEGYLRITAPIAKCSIYTYRLDDGTIQREYVPPTTLFSQDSIDTLKLKPVTNNHPKSFVKSDSFKNLSIGVVGESIVQDRDKLVATFIISSQDGIDAVDSGKNQLSPAYTCEVLQQSGITPDGQHYDAVQINRRYNHLALVPKARGGDELSFKMDSSDTEYGIETIATNNNKESYMATSIRIDGVDHAIENPVVASHIATLTVKADKLDAMESQLTELNTAKVELSAKLDAKDAEIVDLKAKSSDEAIAKRVDAKVALISTAKEILGDELKADASDEAIMESVILKVSPEAKLDGFDGDMKSVYLKARFDAAVEMFSKDAVADQRKQTRKSDSNDTKIDYRQARIDALATRHEEGK